MSQFDLLMCLCSIPLSTTVVQLRQCNRCAPTLPSSFACSAPFSQPWSLPAFIISLCASVCRSMHVSRKWHIGVFIDFTSIVVLRCCGPTSKILSAFVSPSFLHSHILVYVLDVLVFVNCTHSLRGVCCRINFCRAQLAQAGILAFSSGFGRIFL